MPSSLAAGSILARLLALVVQANVFSSVGELAIDDIANSRSSIVFGFFSVSENHTWHLPLEDDVSSCALISMDVTHQVLPPPAHSVVSIDLHFGIGHASIASVGRATTMAIVIAVPGCIRVVLEITSLLSLVLKYS
jgi:hypothetical protein